MRESRERRRGGCLPCRCFSKKNLGRGRREVLGGVETIRGDADGWRLSAVVLKEAARSRAEGTGEPREPAGANLVEEEPVGIPH